MYNKRFLPSFPYLPTSIVFYPFLQPVQKFATTDHLIFSDFSTPFPHRERKKGRKKAEQKRDSNLRKWLAVRE
jgi:hypothetical protein